MSSEKVSSKSVARESVLNHLNQCYSLNSPQVFVLIEGGTSSAVWKFKNGSSQWMIKVFGLEEGPLDRIRDEANLFRYLNDRGIHTPVLLPGKDNSDVSLLNYHGMEFAVFVMRFENLRMASPSTVTQQELQVISRDIARMHLVLESYPGLKAMPDVSPWEEKETANRAIDLVLSSSSVRQFNPPQLKDFDEVDNKMQSYLNSHAEPAPLTRSLIHSDLSLEHAQFLPDDNVYFFDFSDRKSGTVIEEIATFLACLYQWEDISFNRWEELKSWVLEGYQSVFPLTKDDLLALNRFIIIRLLGANNYLAQLAKDEENVHVDNWIRRGYQLGDYLLKNN
ncbi:MAG: phosphotransferase [Candidatus Shapirobacteria bacterium]